MHTNDGTIDINKKPANKNTTGNWKACRFILGMSRKVLWKYEYGRKRIINILKIVELQRSQLS